jgi:centractin
MDLRRNLWQGIVLSGGSTMFKGFCKRLLKETRKIAPPDMKIRITAPTDRLFTTWTGGSILAGLSTFRKIWVTKAEYEEKGPDALRKMPS